MERVDDRREVVTSSVDCWVVALGDARGQQLVEVVTAAGRPLYL